MAAPKRRKLKPRPPVIALWYGTQCGALVRRVDTHAHALGCCPLAPALGR